MRRRFAAVAALLLLVTACASPPPARVAPAGESKFVYIENLDVITDWDPATSFSNELIAMQNVYETLTVWNPVTRRAAPRLATTWHPSADGKTWTFTLRPGMTFHTGRPVDAAAVKASIERTLKVKGGAYYIWDSVSSIRVDDPLTVSFTLKYAVPLDLAASSSYAGYIYDTQAAPDLKAWFGSGKDAGSGPYTVAAWRKGKENELTLKAYRDYWGGWDQPHYTSVEYRVIPDPDRAWRLLQRGEASFVQRLNSRLYARAKATPGVRTSQRESFQTAMILFNTASGPMKDVRIRKAVQKAVDYRGVVKALNGAASPLSGIVPEGLLGHVPDRVPRQDLAGAAELLKRAGYGPGGKPLRLSLTYAEGDTDQRLLVTRLSMALRRLNVTLDSQAMPWNAQWDRGKKHGQDIFVMYWWPDYPDGYSWFTNTFHSAEPVTFNLTYLRDPVTDRLIDSLPALTVTDRAGVQQVFDQLTTRLINVRSVVAMPWVVNYQRAYLGSIQGYDDNPAYPDVVFVYELRPSG